MKIRELEAFDAYMRYGSTKAAADALALSQPMISRLLISLEEKLGFILFQRKRNRLDPTPEAFLFHDSALRMIETFHSVRDDAKAIANKQLGRIVIAAQPIFCDTFLLDVIARFKQTHPNVSIQLVDVGLEVLLKMIAEQSCDMALGITLDANTYGATITPLGRCEARCLLPVGHPLDQPGPIPLPRLRHESFVELSSGSPLRTRVDHLMQTMNVHRKIAAEMRHVRGVCALVERNVGVAIIDPIAELLLDDRKVVIKQLTPSIEWKIALFQPKDRQLSTVAEIFYAGLLEEINVLTQKNLIAPL
ncbi:LysR family transcriptional regulator [Yoonia sp. MH D7]